MSGSEWTTILDMFEARLHAQREAMSMGPAAIEPWTPPAAVSPIPRNLAERATQLVEECRALEDEIERALAATVESLDRLGDAPPAPATAAQPMYFDSRV